MMIETVEGVVSAIGVFIVMFIVATLIMAVCYGVPYLVWRLWRKADRVIQRTEIKYYQRRSSSTKPQEGHEALRAAIRKQGES